jgi:hypothetical protein
MAHPPRLKQSRTPSHTYPWPPCGSLPSQPVSLPAQAEWLRLFFEPNLFPYKYPIFSIPVILHTYLPMKMEQTECSETLALKLQMLVNNLEERIQHSKHSESLKSRNIMFVSVGHFSWLMKNCNCDINVWERGLRKYPHLSSSSFLNVRKVTEYQINGLYNKKVIFYQNLKWFHTGKINWNCNSWFCWQCSRGHKKHDCKFLQFIKTIWCILLYKLDAYSIRGVANLWFKSYISDWKQ